MVESNVLWLGFLTLSLSLSLSLDHASLLYRVKEGYFFWVGIVPHISKTARFTIGARIEDKFLDLLELSYTSYFSEKDKKAEKLSECIFTIDILKFLVSTAWEEKFISNKQYENIATKMGEIGKMFWGWKKSLDNPQKTPLKAGKR